MEVGLVGKPNVGKSTLFNAITLGGAEIANYPFTTIDPNRGVAHVRSQCPHGEFGVVCTPNNSACSGGTRLLPVEVIDVAGLVKGAHDGKGLGNRFLDNLCQASALIHVIDASGGTDPEGNPVDPGTHDPLGDVGFLEDEVAHWMKGILARDFSRKSKQMEGPGVKLHMAISERLTGLAISHTQVQRALRSLDLPDRPSTWGDDHLLELSRNIREVAKPLSIAANKCDVAPAKNLERLMALRERGYRVRPVCAEVELALARASRAGVLEYLPGAEGFTINEGADLSKAQRKGLEKMAHIMERMGGTGVTPLLEDVVFGVLDLIVIYPVEDESKLTDKQGRVLPDAHLVPRGTTAREFAYRIHTDLGDRFIRALDVRTKRTVGADHELRDRDIIKIVADS